MDYHRIFISYRRDGGDITAKLISEALKNQGYTTFYDYDALKGGVFDDQIRNEIINCTDMILVLPKNALDRCNNENDWVRMEIALALKHGKNIIPVMLHGFEFPDMLPEDIDKVRYYNGVRFYMEFFDAVIEGITRKLSPLPQSYMTESQPPKEKSKEIKVKKERRPKIEHDEPATSNNKQSKPIKTFLQITSMLLWVLSIALLIPSGYYYSEYFELEIALPCLFFGILSAYVGVVCYMLFRYGAVKKSYRICSLVAFSIAVVMLIVGLTFLESLSFLIICKVPFICLFTLLGVLFLILHFSQKKSIFFTVLYPVLSVIISVTLLFGVYPFYHRIEYEYDANRGDSYSQYSLAHFYEFRLSDYDAALLWYKRSLSGGNQDAAEALGDIYYHGHGTIRNYPKAAELYLYSCYDSDYKRTQIKNRLKSTYREFIPELLTCDFNLDELDADTAYYLGTMYLMGIRSNSDYDSADEIAIKLFEIAVDGGHASAPFFLGQYYLLGNGVPKDEEKATELFNLATERGYPYNIEKAIENLSD